MIYCYICRKSILTKHREDKEGPAHENCYRAQSSINLRPSGVEKFDKKKKMWPSVVSTEVYEEHLAKMSKKIIEENTIGEMND